MTKTKTQAEDIKKKPSILTRLFGIRHFLREQKEAAFSSHQKEFFVETLNELKRIKNLKIEPTRVETFNESLIRNKVTPEFLQSQMEKFRAVHLTLYCVSGVLLVYALYLSLNFSPLLGFGALVASLGAAVNGYLQGFRAWQIKHRNLIRLQDAIRILDTYLVL